MSATLATDDSALHGPLRNVLGVELYAGMAYLLDVHGQRVSLGTAIQRAIIQLAHAARRDGVVPVTRPRATVHRDWLYGDVIVRVEAFAVRSIFPEPW